jgi:hypothetical protein
MTAPRRSTSDATAAPAQPQMGGFDGVGKTFDEQLHENLQA